MTNELYHHGILGQKWGVRRFQNKDGSLTNAGEKRYSDGYAGRLGEASDRFKAKAEKALTNRGRVKAIKDQYDLKKMARGAEAISKEKTLVGKAKAAFGDSAKQRSHQTESEKNKAIAEQSTNRLQSAYADIAAYNEAQLAKTYEKRANVKTTTKVGQDIALKILTGHDKEYYDTRLTPMKTITGRETTQAKEEILKRLTGGIGNLVLDIKYEHDHYDELKAQGEAHKQEIKARQEKEKEARKQAFRNAFGS